MNKIEIEHINITVSDPDKTAALLGRVFGWEIRWSGESLDGGRTIHVGTDNQYLAIYANPKSKTKPEYRGINHIGVLVEDLESVETKVKAEGLATTRYGNYEPGRRFYFRGLDDLECEVVSYRSP